jgi:hypothetical protein
MEVMVALGLLTLAVVTLSQVAVFALSQRRQQLTHLELLEVAANILESARVQPPAALTPEWAASQKLPAYLAERALDAKLTLSVQPYPASPPLKKVSVQITWFLAPRQAAPPVKLEGIFGAPALAQGGTKP